MRTLSLLVLWLSLMTTPFAALVAVDAAMGPSSHERASRCTRACHDHGCPHLEALVDVRRSPAKQARQLYLANIRALRAPSFGYRDTNLLVYVLGFPALYGLLSGVALARRRWRPSVVVSIGGMAVPALLLGFAATRVDVLLQWGTGRNAAYWLCTDFCIHAGNLTGLTYDGFNYLLFVVGFPATTLVLAGAALWPKATERAGGDDAF